MMNVNTGHPRISAATIKIRKPLAADATPLEALRRLDKELASVSNKHERVIALITACIWNGIRDPNRIATTLIQLGFNSGHVWIQLKKGTGSNPDLHRWRSNADGRLSLLQ